MEEKLCVHCKRKLESEREIYIACCFVCRRYALLLGVWPEDDKFHQDLPTSTDN